ncbi:histidine kinase [Catenuloplanes sp. NPDC051500]|uniref:histidine kinase n=1 Tax=Catenuloplanes sp. NPDC051500 TaxID=3363959 RepID=UPI0037B06A73
MSVRIASRPALQDLALGAAIMLLVLGATVIGGDDHDSRQLHAVDIASAVAAAGLIAARRRWPVPVLAAATLATAAATAATDLLPPFAAAALVAAYTTATMTSRITAWTLTATAAVVVYLAAVQLGGVDWQQPETVSVIAWGGMATALGDVARTRRAYLEAVLERAQRAERSREETARRRVIDERLRIARELHDVVAHHIALINVQAGVAAHVLDDQPETARQSLAVVRQAGRAVLADLSTVLGVLRTPGDPDDPAGEPTPGLARLDDLLRTLAGSGLQVAHQSEGQARTLPAAVDHAAFRIVQEALTNAHKHGNGGVVRLHLTYTPEEVSISVDNAARIPGAAGGAGRGLMRAHEHASSGGDHELIAVHEHAAGAGHGPVGVREHTSVGDAGDGLVGPHERASGAAGHGLMGRHEQASGGAGHGLVGLDEQASGGAGHGLASRHKQASGGAGHGLVGLDEHAFAGTGYGLLGVRERAAAVGGTVTARGDRDGVFRLRAHLPAPSTTP